MNLARSCTPSNPAAKGCHSHKSLVLLKDADQLRADRALHAYRSFLILLSFAPRRLAPSCLGLSIFCGDSMRLRLVTFRTMLLSASCYHRMTSDFARNDR